MKQLSTILFAVTFVLANFSGLNAQVTLNMENLNYVPGIVSTVQQSDGVIDINLGEAGANRSWDFSGIQLETELTEYLVDPEGLPGSDDFPNATVAWYQEGQPLYSYVQVTNEFTDYLGIASYVEMWDSTITAPIELEGHIYNFPIQYGDEWDVVMVTNFFGNISTDSIHFMVDAWGTVTDVAGQFECLRIRGDYHNTLQQGDDIELEDSYTYMWIVPNFGTIVTIDSEDNEQNPDFSQGEFKRLTSIEGVGVAHRTNPAIPAVSGLDPAFPNPFNPQTQLVFKVAQPGMVVLNVYDTNGRVVSSVVNGFYAPGSYQAPFNAVGLSSGTYFAKFSAGNVTQTQQLLLTK